MSQTNNFRHKCEYHSYIDAGKLVRGCAPVTHGFRLNIAGRLLCGVGEELPFVGREYSK